MLRCHLYHERPPKAARRPGFKFRAPRPRQCAAAWKVGEGWDAWEPSTLQTLNPSKFSTTSGVGNGDTGVHGILFFLFFFWGGGGGLGRLKLAGFRLWGFGACGSKLRAWSRAFLGLELRAKPESSLAGVYNGTETRNKDKKGLLCPNVLNPPTSQTPQTCQNPQKTLATETLPKALSPKPRPPQEPSSGTDSASPASRAPCAPAPAAWRTNDTAAEGELHVGLQGLGFRV